MTLSNPLLPVLACSILVASCAGIDLGSGNVGSLTANEPPPSGLILRQANFFGQNGKTVSGTAVLYAADSGALILRLDGLSAPSETGLQVRVTANGSLAFSGSLRATKGSMNYSTGLAINMLWNSVTLYSTVNQSNYATATF